jgi:hypothetical protein
MHSPPGNEAMVVYNNGVACIQILGQIHGHAASGDGLFEAGHSDPPMT